MCIMSEITSMHSGIAQRFIEDVERRCEALGMKPQKLCVRADVAYGAWRSWTVDGKAPNATTMDKVLAELERREKMRDGG